MASSMDRSQLSYMDNVLQWMSSSRVPAQRHSLISSKKSAANNEPEENYLMVAAIDFGTTFSGYAFSFSSNPEVISMNKNWGAQAGCEMYQTPTSVLTKADGSFEAFGHEAETKYSALVEEGHHHRFELYRHFKMILHQAKDISRHTMIKSESGKKTQAMNIFVMALKYLKDQLLDTLAKSVANAPTVDMIRWVLTVPAIWTDGAKQFMRESAAKAGLTQSIDSTQLMIALEPEVASLFCRRIDIAEYIMRGELTELPFTPHTKYLVIDAGGGTVDITAHEVLMDECIRELHVANGGPWGGIQVDKQFVKLLKKVLGDEFIPEFMKKNPSQWLTMMTAFEKAKKLVTSEGDSKLNVSITWALGQKFKQHSGENIETTINKFEDDGISFQNGSIVLSHKASVSLFTKVTNTVNSHVQNLLQDPKLRDISYVVLVGGFGESKMLQKAIKQALSPRNITLIVPPEAQLAVIKGAVHFGHNKKEIRSRIARKTYGTDTMHRFDPRKHDEKRKRQGNNRDWCDDVFEVFVREGESIEAGHVIERRKTAVYEGQTAMDIDIYCTDKQQLREVEYVDAPYMEKLGGIHVEMPSKKKEVMVQFLFGGTEIQVKATDRSSGCTAHTRVNFLTD